MKTLLTLILTVLMVTASAQSYFRLTRGGITGTDLAMMLINEGFDDWVLDAQRHLPKITAKMPARPTVPQWPDLKDEWGQYSIAMRQYSLLYNEQLNAREQYIHIVADKLVNSWLFQIEAYMKVCPNAKGKAQWCWTSYSGNYSHYQWAQILLQVWRKLPTYPSNFVAFHMNDHRLQLKNK